MKTCSFGVLWFVLLCSGLISSTHGEEYLIDEDTDGVLLSCAVAFFVLCAVFFIVVVIASVLIYKRAKSGNMRLRTEKYKNESVEGVSVSSPFYGHGIYSPRPESSIYLPGREYSYVSEKPSKSAIYESEEADLNENKEEGSPPKEKGQRDAMMGEKKVSNTYDNPAFENQAYESVPCNNDYESTDGHDYEMLDASSKPETK